MLKKLVFILLNLTFWLMPKAHAQIWPAPRAWDAGAEAEFAAWVSQQQPDILRKLGISTDCADAVISIRWIFARTHGLVAANTLDDGSLFSSQSTRFNSLKTDSDLNHDERFLTALKYMINHSSTKTLFVDTYPVALNRLSLQPGAVYIHPGSEMGHAQLVARLDLTGKDFPITFFESTVPQQVRDLFVYPFLKIHHPDPIKKDSFRRFRWPISSGSALMPEAQMPGYSNEQFNIKSRQPFDEYTFQKLGLDFDGFKKLNALVFSMIERLQARQKLVKEAVLKCASTPSCKPHSELYEAYSTFGRDAAVDVLIKYMYEVISSAGANSSALQIMANDLLQTQVVDIQGRRLTLNELILIWNQNSFSSDPTLSELQRWGL